MRLLRDTLAAAPRRRVLPACVLLAAFGCGLGDYENHIDAQRERLKTFDEENKFLGGAINVPTYKAKTKANLDIDLPYWPFDVFLRLPKDMSTEPTRDHFGHQNLPLFRYPTNRDGYNAFIAAGLIAEKRPPDKDGKPRPPEWSIDTFRDSVRGALMDYYRKEYKALPEFPAFERSRFQKMVKQPLDEGGQRLSPVAYEAIAFKDDFNRNLKEFSLFQVYIHQAENRQVAIIFQSPLTWISDDNLIKAVDWSLKTLETGPHAGTRRIALEKRKRR
jgi:hypothetical protein